jgi:hypothetical protein
MNPSFIYTVKQKEYKPWQRKVEDYEIIKIKGNGTRKNMD